MQDFIHLHVHTEYSILDGQSKISKLVDKAIGDGMRGMAVTDHGCMMGIKEFYNYVKKRKSEAKGDIKAYKALVEQIEAGTYSPDPTKKDEFFDVGISREDLLEKYRKKIEKAEAVVRFKPIFGCEMYVAHNSMASKSGRNDSSGWHLIVLAKNEKGYHNLIKLVSDAWTDGFYMKPRTDHAHLEARHEGLIVSSACLAGEIPSAILRGDLEAAEKSVQWFKKVFGDDFYLELQRHEVKDPNQRANRETFVLQERVNPVLVELSKKYGIKLICTNDCHFVDQENAEAHDRLICLSTNKVVNDQNRMLYSKQEWFKTRAEMNEVFKDHPEALSNTCEICDKVEEYSIDHAPIMPNFDIPETFGTEEGYRKKFSEKALFDEFTRDENGAVVCSQEEGEEKIKKLGGYDKLYRIKLEADYLAKLTYEGAKRRYGDPLPENVAEQIKFELHIMKTMGFPGYFLIVQDYINVARNELDVSVGPGRGSAAGSVVAYCLGITQIDPIKYDLLFERFLNPDRISLPDIDVDFDDDGRGRVLDWVTKKYGADKVAHIITYSTLATKSAISSVARVEELPLAESQRLVKAIPDRLMDPNDSKKQLKINLTNVLKYVPEIQAAANSDNPLLSETIKYAQMLESNVRGTGIHACGIIICRDPISDWVPVSTAEDKETGEKLRCTQYEGSVIEETGLIKMDFLGLKNLSILKEAVENIRDSLGIKINVDDIPLDDAPTYQLFCDGRTVGVFQFESAGMQKYLHELQPSKFEDLIAMNALYRPGPMDYIPDFIDRKQGRKPIVYDLPCMEKYLKDTYGITVYQEQVMLLSRLIANFTRGESDTLRKAMGKKQIEKLNHLYPKFIEGGKANGHDPQVLEKIWNDWRKFASYAFNKSHATCYSWVAYQTAYLKANYPSQYMAAVMSRSLNDITEISKLMDECKTMGIETLGPDINESRIKFSVNSRNNIRFGLGAIKGIGAAAAEIIIAERDKNGAFKDIFDFMQRVDLSACNRRVMENLALSGAFDCFSDICREQYFELSNRGDTFIEQLLRYGQTFQQDKMSNTNTLFGDMEGFEITKPDVPQTYHKWTDLERLNKERDLIGIYLSAHPLDEYAVVLKNICNLHFNQLKGDLKPYAGMEVYMGGIVVSAQEKISKKGKPFGIVTMEDYEGQGELLFFGNDWTEYRNKFIVGEVLYIKGRVQGRRWNPDELDFYVSEVAFLADVKEQLIESLTIQVPLALLDEKTCLRLTDLVKTYRGSTSVYFSLEDANGKPLMNVRSKAAQIDVSGEFIKELDRFDGIRYHIN